MEHLEAVTKIITLLLGFGGIAKWIVHRIERGQKEVITEHKRDFKMLKKELKKRISKDECERLRSQCPCNQINRKDLTK